MLEELGARSGGVGSLASAGATRAIVTPVDGMALSSLPERSFVRSGAVSAARAWSIFHLNLSQPLGSSAAQAEVDASKANTRRAELRIINPPLS